MGIPKTIYLVCIGFLSVSVQAQHHNADSLLNIEVHRVMDQFIKSAVLSGDEGQYSERQEEIFRSLLTDDAAIYHFLPESSYSGQLSDVNAYCREVRDYLNDWEFFPAGVHELVEVIHLEEGRFRARGKITLDLDMWYMKDHDAGIGVHTKEVVLSLDIIGDPERGSYLIREVNRYSPAYVDLRFRLLDENNRPLSSSLILFSYQDPNISTETSQLRERRSDPNGYVSLSIVPADALIHIGAGEGYELINDEMISASQWNSLEESRRILFLREVRPVISRMERPIRSYFKLSAGYDLFALNSEFIQHSSSVLNERVGPKKEIKPSFGISLTYSHEFLRAGQFSLLAGTGLGYQRTEFDFVLEKLAQEFVGLDDDDDDILNLHITATNLQETYTHESFSVPLTLTLRYPLQEKHFSWVDLSFHIMYAIWQESASRYRLEQRSEAYYPKYNLWLYDVNMPPYNFTEDVLAGHSQEIITQDYSLTYGVSLKAHYPFMTERLWLQAGLSYHFMQTGVQQFSEPEKPHGNEENLLYIPLLEFGKHRMGFLQFGLGITYGF